MEEPFFVEINFLLHFLYKRPEAVFQKVQSLDRLAKNTDLKHNTLLALEPIVCKKGRPCTDEIFSPPRGLRWQLE